MANLIFLDRLYVVAELCPLDTKIGNCLYPVISHNPKRTVFCS